MAAAMLVPPVIPALLGHPSESRQFFYVSSGINIIYFHNTKMLRVSPILNI